MAENAREIVLDTLLEIERNKVYSNQLVKAVLDKYDYLEGQEKRFIKRVVEGCVERKIELDYYLNQYSTVPVNKMKPLIRCLMRMGVYQILYMDGIPDSAACNEAVKLANKRKFTNLKGFVNGVLRKIVTNKERLPLPDAETAPLLYLSVKYSMPEWIVSMWLEEYGKADTTTILDALAAIHPISVRFRTDMSEAERERYIQTWEKQGVLVKESGILPYVYSLENVEGVGSLEGFVEGAFAIQDVSSALSVEAAEVSNTDVCMDICAAPGGKTMLAAEKAKTVLSRDVSENKVALIEENCERMQLLNKVITQVWDATVFDESKVEFADVVLMDVPCSGLGVMGKKRDIKYHVTPEGLESLMELQQQIVESSWQYVKKGGILLYSTCTINRAENQDRVKWICDNLPFALEEEKQILPGFMEADGFYYARLRRNAE
ncbi:MAG: 16S rRNA (cytosine(967)-C(5))-methyltransferase RsmB [Lachnospiraceae bacterium]|nr:16S rRNA (cytosine(967)-C(5))-methyltransferase RsmB [Lachnospiraceae bacterium]